MTPLPDCSGESSYWNNGTLWKRQDSGNMKFLCSSDTPIHKFACYFLLLLELHFIIRHLNSAVVS